MIYFVTVKYGVVKVSHNWMFISVMNCVYPNNFVELLGAMGVLTNIITDNTVIKSWNKDQLYYSREHNLNIQTRL